MKSFLFSTVLSLCFLSATAQNVSINNDGSAPDPKAQLDVKSANKGVLFPRITDLSAITGSVPLGLLVFVTDGDRGFYYNASALAGTPNWKKISSGDDAYWQYASPNYLYWNGAANVGIGIATPQAKLHVSGAMAEKLRLENTTALAAGTSNELYFKTGTYFTGAIKTIGDGPAVARLGLFTYSTSNIQGLHENLSILDNGNIGISNTNPTEAGLVADKKVGAVNAMFGSNTTGVAIETAWPGIGLNSYYNNGRFLIANGAGGYIGMNPTNGRLIFANAIILGNAGSPANTQDKMYIENDGTVYLGSANLAAEDLAKGSGYKLRVFGKAIAEEVRVQLRASWPDYVFKKTYNLMPLSQLENFVAKNNHLPNIPRASVVEKEGMELGEMQRKMMEKIEELTLYIIEQNKRIEALEKKLSEPACRKNHR